MSASHFPEDNVAVRINYGFGESTEFRVDRHQPLRTTLESFTDIVSVQSPSRPRSRDSLRFRTVDNNLPVREDTTADSLEIAVGEVLELEAFPSQIGGGSESPPPDDNPDKKITIKVVYGDDQSVMFSLKRTKALAKMFEAFHAQLRAQPNTYRFSYEGERILPEHTPKMLEMDPNEENQVDAVVQQVGGGSSSF